MTGNIDFISKKDLIGILQHLKENKSAQQESQKSSAQSRILDKIYLMSGNKEAGGTHWNLRLHNYSVRGNGLGGEESPHYHRWTLGSAILAGGYNNINYSEQSTSQPHDSKNRYNKYLLGATGAQESQSGQGAGIDPRGQGIDDTGARARLRLKQSWERACSRRSFASRLAPTGGLDRQQSIYIRPG
ncbi:hypothetical protein [Pseudomonas deceptionensis]|uniref:Uncharacterized protein n=1 Tax=Pseudomonas deceptionensis TaxID=882211 RepID=A0A0J6G511_PSEDM|nr:hypothetical protein [Pseudomonas deceptionensis]KMM80046.1 hypothetical protein TR67_09530 [Pseudomonas deceptionensis]SEF07519.1 hypothetical protein SAMN04489800_4338 [Pseudomonas deceptionensis]